MKCLVAIFVWGKSIFSGRNTKPTKREKVFQGLEKKRTFLVESFILKNVLWFFHQASLIFFYFYTVLLEQMKFKQNTYVFKTRF